MQDVQELALNNSTSDSLIEEELIENDVLYTCAGQCKRRFKTQVNPFYILVFSIVFSIVMY